MQKQGQDIEVERQKCLLKQLAEWEKTALSQNLTSLADYCNEGEITPWPSDKLLYAIGNSVKNLLRFTHQRVRRGPFGDHWPPPWNAFRLLDRRMPKLRLVQRVDNLAKRAKDRLCEAKEPNLFVLFQQAIEGNKAAQNLVRDIDLVQRDLRAARKIDWAQHERALAQFSPTRSVDLACKQSALPEAVRCYGRVLELIVESESQWNFLEGSRPLTQWIMEIGHPVASDLKRFDEGIANGMKRIAQFVEYANTQRKRELGCERVRRHRAKNSLPEKRYTTRL